MKDFVTINTSANICFLSILLFFVFVVLFRFFFFFTSESHVKLLIRGENLPKDKEEFMEKMLAQLVENYVKFKVHPRDNASQALKTFIDHLNEAYGLLLFTIGIVLLSSFWTALH